MKSNAGAANGLGFQTVERMSHNLNRESTMLQELLRIIKAQRAETAQVLDELTWSLERADESFDTICRRHQHLLAEQLARWQQQLRNHRWDRFTAVRYSRTVNAAKHWLEGQTRR